MYSSPVLQSALGRGEIRAAQLKAGGGRGADCYSHTAPNTTLLHCPWYPTNTLPITTLPHCPYYPYCHTAFNATLPHSHTLWAPLDRVRLDWNYQLPSQAQSQDKMTIEDTEQEETKSCGLGMFVALHISMSLTNFSLRTKFFSMLSRSCFHIGPGQGWSYIWLMRTVMVWRVSFSILQTITCQHDVSQISDCMKQFTITCVGPYSYNRLWEGLKI